MDWKPIETAIVNWLDALADSLRPRRNELTRNQFIAIQQVLAKGRLDKEDRQVLAEIIWMDP